MKRQNLFIGAIGLALSMVSSLAQAETFPVRPITLIVPFAAGGGTDTTARRLGAALSSRLSVSVVIDNRPGASTAIAADYVKRARKDGYTLLFAPVSTTSVNPHLFRDLTYSLDDFAAISLVSKVPYVLTAKADLPAKTIPDFIQFAKDQKDGLTYGSVGTGSSTNVIGEWIGRTLGIKLIEVPYKGTGPATVDLIAGRIDLNVDALSAVIANHQAGKFRVLAIMADMRSSTLPDVPTFKEAGYQDLTAYVTFGLLAPAGTPDDVIESLHHATVAAVASADFAGKMTDSGEVPELSKTPKDYETLLRDEYEKWGRIIKPMNLNPQ